MQVFAKCRVAGWPTPYLIDHRGVIRKWWVGGPAAEVLDREIELLLQAAVRDK